jgi:hypothetical protein
MAEAKQFRVLMLNPPFFKKFSGPPETLLSLN